MVLVNRSAHSTGPGCFGMLFDLAGGRGKMYPSFFVEAEGMVALFLMLSSCLKIMSGAFGLTCGSLEDIFVDLGAPFATSALTDDPE